MSISLKTLYDQVQSMSTSGVKTLSKGTNGYMEFQNGFIINWGLSTQGPPPGSPDVWNSYKFSKPFSSSCTAVVTGDIAGEYNRQNNPSNLRNISKTGFELLLFDYFTVYWIAIGYLITNSIRSLLGGGLKWL